MKTSTPLLNSDTEELSNPKEIVHLGERYLWQQFFIEVRFRIAAWAKKHDLGYIFPMWGIIKTLEVIKGYLPKIIFLDAVATLRECLWKYFPQSLLSEPILAELKDYYGHKYYKENASIFSDRKKFDEEKDIFDESLRVWNNLWNYLPTPQTRMIFATSVIQVQECWITSFLAIDKRIPRTDCTHLRNAVLVRTLFPQDYQDRQYKKYREKQLEEKKQALEEEAKANAAAAAAVLNFNKNKTYSAMAGISGDSKAAPGAVYSQFGRPVVPTTKVVTKPAVVPLFGGKTAEKNAGSGKRSAGRSLKPRKQTKLVKAVRLTVVKPIKKFKIGEIDEFRTMRLWLALKKAWDAYHELPKKSSIGIKLKKYLNQIEFIIRSKLQTSIGRKRLLTLVIRAQHALKKAGHPNSLF